jgi:hypothetical protein
MASPTPPDPEGASPRRVRECTDPSARLPALSVALVCRVTVDLAPVLEVGWVAGRDRRVIAIVGGTVTGDRLRGIVLPGGADWQWVDEDGVAAIDTRYAMRTHDGALVTIATSGYRHGPPAVIARVAAGEVVPADQYYFRIAARFETSAARYAWLNRTVFVAVAAREADRVSHPAPGPAPTRPALPAAAPRRSACNASNS